MQLNGIKRQSCKGFNYFGSVLNIEVMAHISCEHITCSIPYSHSQVGFLSVSILSNYFMRFVTAEYCNKWLH